MTFDRDRPLGHRVEERTVVGDEQHRAWERLAKEYADKGRTLLWELAHPNLDRWSSDEPQATAAARIGMSTTALSRNECRFIAFPFN